MFGCIRCGYQYLLFPPDDIHTEGHSIVDESNTKDYSKMEYACNHCGNINKIYWHRESKTI